MIHRIRSRAAFQRLAADGRRIRRPALWCTWYPEPDSMVTAVAFAIGRALGPAVSRNRLRRRLRALLRAHDRWSPLPTGLLLIGARPAAVELTYEELRIELDTLLAAIRP